ncbi:MAG TPA: MBL fold metallo-hydrolase [Solirubrobacteraceae bacterium]|jgi:flavorubredoxin
MTAIPAITPVANPARQIADGIWWIPACQQVLLEGKFVHIHNAPYLVMGRDKTLLWDTSPGLNWSGTERELDALLGDRPIDYLVPSHPEGPHCGNLQRLLSKYPDATVLGDVRDYHLYFPTQVNRFVPYPPRKELSLGGAQTIIFLPAIVKDLPSSQWAYAPDQRVLFTADAFAYSHMPSLEGDDRPAHAPGQCGLTATELDALPSPEQVLWITRAALYWAHFRELAPYRTAFERLLRAYPADIIAPAHGAVIDDMSFVPAIWDALDIAFDPEGAANQSPSYTPAFEDIVSRKLREVAAGQSA